MAPFLSRYLPPVALMGLIFLLSAQPSLSSGLGSWDLVLRKLAHMAEFGLLWLLWWRALDRRRPVLATVVALLYAASDELHQTFVPGRVGSPTDVLIDAAGVGLAALLTVVWLHRRARRAAGRRGARRYGQPRSVA